MYQQITHIEKATLHNFHYQKQKSQATTSK